MTSGRWANPLLSPPPSRRHQPWEIGELDEISLLFLLNHKIWGLESSLSTQKIPVLLCSALSPVRRFCWV
ncbi:hypothetical protein SLEP1_g28662 [Rubroshorea leprosula]|uniref:Uncharacterized protein n=1 Tax=Rubroshorea leprosula TaxID=152421 RepID=A0AAV5K318_9ROSI|nr:hypothetical protein SLEP1_g28662 [Rubroshorea leprosula]